MEPSIQNLLIQIPLVGIFIWFILEQQKRADAAALNRQQKADAEQEKRDNDWRNFLQQQYEKMSEQDKQWREFIAEQRDQSNAAIARLAEEIKGNSLMISQMNGTLISHDVASRERSARAQK